VLAAREQIAPGGWIDVSYEELVGRPVAELRGVYETLGLQFGDSARAYAANLANHVSRTALDAPRDDKWREQVETMDDVLPRLADLERRLGYG
jgi:hypothetical protein